MGDNTVRELRRLEPSSAVLNYFPVRQPREGDDPAPASLPQQPAGAGELPRSHFECTCGWQLTALEDLDAGLSFMRCGRCAGIAVRVTR